VQKRSPPHGVASLTQRNPAELAEAGEPVRIAVGNADAAVVADQSSVVALEVVDHKIAVVVVVADHSMASAEVPPAIVVELMEGRGKILGE
jgi:hypothetical protein